MSLLIGFASCSLTCSRVHQHLQPVIHIQPFCNRLTRLADLDQVIASKHSLV